MLLSKKFSLVLHFQLNEQQKVKAVRVSGTDSTVKGGLEVVQIGIAVLVKVSVFRVFGVNFFADSSFGLS